MDEAEARSFYAARIAQQQASAPGLHQAERSRAVLDDPVIEWQDFRGQTHMLMPVGAKVRYTGHVMFSDVMPERTELHKAYAAAPGVVADHSLDDEVSPYLVRIDADGETVRCTPGEVAPAGSGRLGTGPDQR